MNLAVVISSYFIGFKCFIWVGTYIYRGCGGSLLRACFACKVDLFYVRVSTPSSAPRTRRKAIFLMADDVFNIFHGLNYIVPATGLVALRSTIASGLEADAG